MRFQIVTARLLVCLAMVLAASPARAQWTYIADAARVSSPEAVALKDGRVLIGGGLPAGGDFFNGWTRDAWIYDPVKKEWKHVPILYRSQLQHDLYPAGVLRDTAPGIHLHR